MHSSWTGLLRDVLETDEYKDLQTRLTTERENKVVYPPKDDVFAAFELPFDDVRIVILGQDPYHGAHQAHGLSFSVVRGTPPPPSLLNILKEARQPLTRGGDLTPWSKQGVLLLNSVLTVEAGRPKSHANLGWQLLTREVMRILSERKERLVVMLWGRDAQSQVTAPNPKHLILKASHSSPLEGSP